MAVLNDKQSQDGQDESYTFGMAGSRVQWRSGTALVHKAFEEVVKRLEGLILWSIALELLEH
jgi:hypothetical protein